MTAGVARSHGRSGPTTISVTSGEIGTLRRALAFYESEMRRLATEARASGDHHKLEVFKQQYIAAGFLSDKLFKTTT